MRVVAFGVLRAPSFHVVGVHHRLAPLDIRARLALAPDEILALLVARSAPDTGVALLATCNRIELYWTGDADLRGAFAAFAEARGIPDDVPLLARDGMDAVEHLVRVAAGLDSQILGETEILGQLRRAFELAKEAGTATPDLEILIAGALTAGRRIRHETSLGRHPASVGSAALRLVLPRWGGASAGKRVVVLGAGEAAEATLRALHRAGGAHVTLVNRNQDRARAIAAAHAVADVRDWDALPALLAAADLVVAATAAREPVVCAAQLAAAVAHRPDRPLCVLDLAVPRNVERAARDVAGVTVWDLDDMRSGLCPVRGEVPPPEAEALVAEEVARIAARLRDRTLAPALAELHRLGARVVEEECAAALAGPVPASEADRALAARVAEQVARRMLYPVSRALRAAPGACGKPVTCFSGVEVAFRHELRRHLRLALGGTAASGR